MLGPTVHKELKDVRNTTYADNNRALSRPQPELGARHGRAFQQGRGGHINRGT